MQTAVAKLYKVRYERFVNTIYYIIVTNDNGWAFMERGGLFSNLKWRAFVGGISRGDRVSHALHSKLLRIYLRFHFLYCIQTYFAHRQNNVIIQEMFSKALTV